jgi:hypothetical protein
MTSLNLSIAAKNDIQPLVEYIQMNPKELDELTKNVAGGNEAAWRRFLKGAYNHPITWWAGIFQLQMQMGVWGYKPRAFASTRASVLWQLTQPLRNEASGLVSGKDAPMLSAIVRYYLKHRKADIVGRLAGGAFTNYASTGGRLGNKGLSKAGRAGTAIKVTAAFTNFGIASYGAAITAVSEGHNSLEAIIQSILIGHTEHLPTNYRSGSDVAPTQEELELLDKVETAVSEVMSLSQVQPAPVPIKEFCARPENIDLKGVCR